MSTDQTHEFQLPPHDELDALLRVWHDENAERAAAGRADLIGRLQDDRRPIAAISAPPRYVARQGELTRSGRHAGTLRAAASLVLLITALALLIPLTSQRAVARQEVILVPEGGRLVALDERGQVMGPCALKHTDVHADIAGPFSRVTVKQEYHNPYQHKIEAVYTFPLSHRAAVDRMTMKVGDRVIEGEVKERRQARQMYESARDAGHVASLLEQERPNIFTQSVANIEPGAQVLIEISYVEMLQQCDGEFTFDFPMVVAPRYIPGSPIASLGAAANGQPLALPNELERREGLILLGPANFERQKIDMLGQIDQGNVRFDKTPLGPAPYLQRIIDAATPIHPPHGAYRAREDVQALYRANPSFDFDVLYADGAREFGQIAGDGLGHVAGRWFYFDPSILAVIQREEARDAAAFAPNTNQVPDASRITPMPVRPPARAGHDISLSVTIDTGAGGPAIVAYKSDLHEIICTDPPTYRDLGNKVNLALKNQSEIPNRDFVLRWRCQDDAIREAVFTHADAKWVDHRSVEITKPDGPFLVERPGMPAQIHRQPALTMDMPQGGGFFTAVIAPPAKVTPEQALARELIFVLDTSGSMQGLPIEKAKAVMSKAIDAMRPGDTFNLITFSGDTRILWKTPRVNTEANRAEAQAFLAGQSGGGGTEMMTAINAALTQNAEDATRQAASLSPARLADLPADGREVVVCTRLDDVEAVVMKSAVMQPVLRVRPDLALKTTSFHFPVEQMSGNPLMELRGKWSTINGERTLEVASAARVDENTRPIDPLRIVMFLTDGQVGNDDAIIAAVRENSKTTRVFSFGIGDSPNRSLLDGVAQAGRGEATYVNLQNDADTAVQAFARRIESPVLRDIQVTFSEGMEVFDLLPAPDAMPDLWDVKPLIVHGRYSSAKPQSGKITITGKTATGDYTRVIDVTLPAQEPANAMLPVLWARAKIDDVLARDDNIRRQGIVEYAADESKKQVIALGERFGITSAFTSFVAIEKTRLTIAGRPMLVPVPIEFPSGMKWEGVFGGDAQHRPADDVTRAMLGDIQNVNHQRAVRLIQLDLARRDATATPEINRQSQMMLDDELRQLNVTRSEFTLAPEAQMQITEWAGKPGTIALEFSNSPQLDLEASLSPAPQQHFDTYRFAQQPPSVLYAIDGNAAEYYGLAQQQLGEVDPATFTRLGIENKSMQAGLQPQPNPAIGLRMPDSEGIWAGSFHLDNQSLYIARGEELSIDAAGRQLRVNPATGKLEPLPTDPGDGGGFGGGGGGDGGRGLAGSGGSIFGEAGAEADRLREAALVASQATGIARSARAASEKEERARREQQVEEGMKRVRELVNEQKRDEAVQVLDEVLLIDEHNNEALAYRARLASPANEPSAVCEQLIEIVRDSVNPNGWREHGGTLAEVNVANCVFTFHSLSDAPEAAGMIDRARGLVMMLAAEIPEVAQIARVDAPPSKPFDPVNDVTLRRDDAPAGVANDDLPPQMTLVIYDVRDLIATIEQSGETDAVDRVINVITNLIAPDYWDIHGGEWGRIQTLKGNLIITIGPPQHRQIEDLLTKVRKALAARNPEAKPAESPVFKGLEAADAPVAAPATRTASDPDIEIYDVHEAVATAMTAQPPLTRSDAIRTVINTIQENVDPEGWRDVGGEIGSIHELANLLVIRNTAKNRDAIRELLQEMEDRRNGQIDDDAKLQATPEDQAQEQARREADAKAMAALAAVQREDRLRRVIDQRLWPLALVRDDVGENKSDESRQCVEVVLLLKDVQDAAAITQLQTLGMRIDDRQVKLNLVAGEIDDVRRLVDVAQLDFVRRIEPVDSDK